MHLMPADIPSDFIERVISELKEHYNVDFVNYNRNFLRRRIASRMNRTGILSPMDYEHILMENAEELSQLLQNITINTSEFMRNPEVFRQLECKFLPDIVRRANGRQIMLWSAGCSKGQEPYSLAMLLLKLKIPQQSPTTIIATDIDEVALNIAERGIYDESSLRNLSRIDVNIFFHRLKNGEYSVDDAIKKLVKFKKHDVVDGPALGIFDMIICRNVSIYFTKILQKRMYVRFWQDMFAMGYLVTGKTEMPPTRFEKRFVQVDFDNRIYQKVE